METEQITQSLRAAMMQQSQQGMTVTQMMSSGLSFADIILTIFGNQQGNSNGLASAGTVFPDFSGGNLQLAEQGTVQNEFAEILGLLTPEILSGLDNSDTRYSELLSGMQSGVSKKSGNIPAVSKLFSSPDNGDTVDITDNLSNSGFSDIEKALNFDMLNLTETDSDLSYSDNMVKADPFQLAGLLDYIGTGTGIPSVTDISDKQIFNRKVPDIVDNSAVDDDFVNNAFNSIAVDNNVNNFEFDNADLLNTDNIRTVSSVPESQFNPEEMLKSGEMEIISYVPDTLGASSDSETADNSGDEGEALEFYRTLNSVKENVKSEDSGSVGVSENAVNLSAEDLNGFAKNIDISFERAAAETTMNKMEYEPADKQLADGISKNLEKGQSEFTVKLKPEGLGEILVKLVQSSEGKMMLTMVASSEKTAELLNRDLASLQSSLNQHNVQISDSGVNVAKNVMPMSSAFDQYDERRQDEGKQQNQFRELKSKIRSVSVQNVSYDAETAAQQSIISDSALNITI